MFIFFLLTYWMSFSFTGFTGYASSIFFSVFALYHLSSLFKLFTTSFVFVSWLAKLYMGTSFTLLDYFKISHSSDFSHISCFNPFIGYLSQASQNSVAPYMESFHCTSNFTSLQRNTKHLFYLSSPVLPYNCNSLFRAA